jgi:hypothetical protein
MRPDPAASIDLQLRLAGAGVPSVDHAAERGSATYAGSAGSPYDADEAAWLGWSGAAGIAAPDR